MKQSKAKPRIKTPKLKWVDYPVMGASGLFVEYVRHYYYI